MRHLLTRILFLISIFVMNSTAIGAILWVGGEDIDFPVGSVTTYTAATYYRSGYARVALSGLNGGIATTKPFPGGAITSGWLSFRTYSANYSVLDKIVGLGKSGNSNSLWVGVDSVSARRVALYKYDGTTWTKLAEEAGNALATSSNKIDMQLISYGATATVKIYVNAGATPVIDYTGDVTVGGNTDLNVVSIRGSAGASEDVKISEVVVADTDTRLVSLVTLAPNAAGTTNNWTSGAYTNINPTTINDAVYNADDTSGHIFEANVTNLPSTNVSVLGVKIIARALKSASGPGSLALGVYTNSSQSYPTEQALQTGWDNYENYFLTNPVTTSNWTAAEIDSLQISLKTMP